MSDFSTLNAWQILLLSAPSIISLAISAFLLWSDRRAAKKAINNKI